MIITYSTRCAAILVCNVHCVDNEHRVEMTCNRFVLTFSVTNFVLVIVCHFPLIKYMQINDWNSACQFPYFIGVYESILLIHLLVNS